VLGGLVAAVSTAFAHGYGYHRDELYFLAAGRHLAWSYPDQGPVTPVLARVMSAIAPHSFDGPAYPVCTRDRGNSPSHRRDRVGAWRRKARAVDRRRLHRGRGSVPRDRTPAQHDDVRPARVDRRDVVARTRRPHRPAAAVARDRFRRRLGAQQAAARILHRGHRSGLAGHRPTRSPSQQLAVARLRQWRGWCW